MKVLKPSSSFVKKQAKEASSGESLFEATPQIILQVCILLIKFDPPTETQISSIISSAASLTYLNTETYIESHEKFLVLEYGNTSTKRELLNIAKFFPLFFLASIFRLLIAIGVPMLDGLGVMAIAIVMVAVLFIVSIILNKKYDLKSEENWQSQRAEFCLLSFLTMTNLTDSRVAAMLRMFSFYFVTCTYLLISTVFLIICNIDPFGHEIPRFGGAGYIVWR